MNCLKFMFLSVSCGVLLAGCKGTGILLMPSKDDPVNNKYKCSSAFLHGSWDGLYEKSKVEITVKPDGGDKQEDCRVDIWIYDKDKKQPLIPMKLIAFQVKEYKYLLFVADIEKILEKDNYSGVSFVFLYPVMKLFKVTQMKPEKLSYQEVIFTKKVGKGEVVKLDPAMKMWGDNSNMLYGTSTEIISYLENGKYQLSEKSTVSKRIETLKKTVKKK